jgi:hypothetical protein
LKRIEAEEAAAIATPVVSSGTAKNDAMARTISTTASLETSAPTSNAPLPPVFSSTPTNRVDLIARTIAHLERLHLLNKTNRESVKSLEQQLDAAKKGGEETAQKLKEAEWKQQQHALMMAAQAQQQVQQQKQQQQLQQQQVRRK